MRIEMIGTRGVPAQYGGFETAVEEVGCRLVERGHQVTVYCRGTSDDLHTYRGMDLVRLPSVRRRSLETLSHTALSLIHELRHPTCDVAIVFNAANSPLLPLLRIRRTPVATHVDGLEWKRGKWGTWGQRYYRVAESLAVRWSDCLIADAQGIADYYTDEFGASTDLISYGAPIVDRDPEAIRQLGLSAGRYHLVVARFEPENHVDLAIEGYLHSQKRLPLIVIGSAPYASGHVDRIKSLASRSEQVRLLGGVWDQALLDQLYANSASYIHGHSVGGTNPSLLRAMGAGAPVVAFDVVFNREVLGRQGAFFSNQAQLSQILDDVEEQPEGARNRGSDLQTRAATVYTWDQVAKRYEQMCEGLASAQSTRGQFSGRRTHSVHWGR